jgi:hypothetical protein
MSATDRHELCVDVVGSQETNAYACFQEEARRKAEGVSRSTGWDLADGWAIGPVGRHRDSDALDQSNSWLPSTPCAVRARTSRFTGSVTGPSAGRKRSPSGWTAPRCMSHKRWLCAWRTTPSSTRTTSPHAKPTTTPSARHERGRLLRACRRGRRLPRAPHRGRLRWTARHLPSGLWGRSCTAASCGLYFQVYIPLSNRSPVTSALFTRSAILSTA